MALVPCQVLRAAILLSYFSILCNYKAIDMPAHQTYGGSWKFLTFINLVIQAVFFGICVLTDLSSLLMKGNDSQEQERQLRKLISLRDWMMAVLAFPIGVFVVTMFWSLYIYDRELVYPKLLDNFIPPWLNHGMHTTVLPFILIEMRTTHHEYPSKAYGLVAVSIFSVGYILWSYMENENHKFIVLKVLVKKNLNDVVYKFVLEIITSWAPGPNLQAKIQGIAAVAIGSAGSLSGERICWIYHVTGVWVYPLLDYLGSGAKIVFFAIVTAIINILYLLGEILNNSIWDTHKGMEEEKEKPKLD